MAYDLDQLFELLPALHRLRDHEQGQQNRTRAGGAHSLEAAGDYGPLRSLLSVLLREGQIVHEDIAQLYDDNFIETCAPWVIPYIGDLVGARELEDIGQSQTARQHVASTLALRQRKGTLSALEYAMRTATGWPVLAVEYWDRMATTESLSRLRMSPGGTANLRDPLPLSQVGTAFDTTPRSAEFGRIETGHGRWNLPNIGLHFYRLNVFAHGTPDETQQGDLVHPTGASGLGQYYFSQFWTDQPLFQRPAIVDLDMSTRPDKAEMPMPIGRWMLLDDPAQFTGNDANPGLNSFSIFVELGTGEQRRFGADEIIAANLSTKSGNHATAKWQHAAHATKVMVDPELGRFVLPQSVLAVGVKEVRVYWHFGSAHDIGARERSEVELPSVFDRNKLIFFDHTTRIDVMDLPSIYPDITVTSNGTHVDLLLDNDEQGFVVGKMACPSLDCAGMSVRIHTKSSKFLLSGLRFLRVSSLSYICTDNDAKSSSLQIEDCTISAKTGSYNGGGIPAGPNRCLELTARQSCMIERSILDAIGTRNDTELKILDSVVTAKTASAPAIAPVAKHSGDMLSIQRCTIFGRIFCDAIGGGNRLDQGPLDVLDNSGGDDDGDAGGEDAGFQNSIILAKKIGKLAPVFVNKTQSGCVRYCYLPQGAVVPRKYACRPSLYDDPAQITPHLGGAYPWHSDFMRLEHSTAREIFNGAEDGQEMGVGNRLKTQARLNNLVRIKDEYLRFGYAAGPCFET